MRPRLLILLVPSVAHAEHKDSHKLQLIKSKRPNVYRALEERSVHVSVASHSVVNAMWFENAFQMFFNFSVQFGGVVSTETRNHVLVCSHACVYVFGGVLVQSDNKCTVELIRFRLLTNGTTDRCTFGALSHARAHISDVAMFQTDRMIYYYSLLFLFFMLLSFSDCYSYWIARREYAWWSLSHKYHYSVNHWIIESYAAITTCYSSDRRSERK